MHERGSAGVKRQTLNAGSAQAAGTAWTLVNNATNGGMSICDGGGSWCNHGSAGSGSWGGWEARNVYTVFNNYGFATKSLQQWWASVLCGSLPNPAWWATLPQSAGKVHCIRRLTPLARPI